MAGSHKLHISAMVDSSIHPRNFTSLLTVLKRNQRTLATLYFAMSRHIPPRPKMYWQWTKSQTAHQKVRCSNCAQPCTTCVKYFLAGISIIHTSLYGYLPDRHVPSETITVLLIVRHMGRRSRFPSSFTTPTNLYPTMTCHLVVRLDF